MQQHCERLFYSLRQSSDLDEAEQQVREFAEFLNQTCSLLVTAPICWVLDYSMSVREKQFFVFVSEMCPDEEHNKRMLVKSHINNMIWRQANPEFRVPIPFLEVLAEQDLLRMHFRICKNGDGDLICMKPPTGLEDSHVKIIESLQLTLEHGLIALAASVLQNVESYPKGLFLESAFDRQTDLRLLSLRPTHVRLPFLKLAIREPELIPIFLNHVIELDEIKNYLDNPIVEQKLLLYNDLRRVIEEQLQLHLGPATPHIVLLFIGNPLADTPVSRSSLFSCASLASPFIRAILWIYEKSKTIQQ